MMSKICTAIGAVVVAGAVMLPHAGTIALAGDQNVPTVGDQPSGNDEGDGDNTSTMTDEQRAEWEAYQRQYQLESSNWKIVFSGKYEDADGVGNITVDIASKPKKWFDLNDDQRKHLVLAVIVYDEQSNETYRKEYPAKIDEASESIRYEGVELLPGCNFRGFFLNSAELGQNADIKDEKDYVPGLGGKATFALVSPENRILGVDTRSLKSNYNGTGNPIEFDYEEDVWTSYGPICAVNLRTEAKPEEPSVPKEEAPSPKPEPAPEPEKEPTRDVKVDQSVPTKKLVQTGSEGVVPIAAVLAVSMAASGVVAVVARRRSN